VTRRLPASLLTALLIGALTGCGEGAAPASPTPTAPPPTAAPSPTRAPAKLWALRRGEAKSDQLWGVDVDGDGNVYTSGYFQSPASAAYFDIVTWKFAPDGQELWRSQFGKDFEEKAFIVKVAGQYVLVGGEQRESASLSQSTMLLLALDPSDGHIAWQWTWSSGVGYHEVDGVIVDGNSVYVSGWTGSAKASGEVAVAKLGLADGRQAWVRTWGGPKFDEADGQLVVDNEFLYVSGRYGGEALTGGKALIAKFSKATGEYVAHVSWGDGPMSDGLGMTSDGTNLYVTGLTLEGLNGQILLLKLDKSLQLLWQRTWGGKEGESARALAVDRSGDVLIAGHTFSRGSGSSDIALLKFSANGTLAWEQIWGGPARDEAHGLVIAGDAAYIAGETANGSAGQTDGLLLRVNALLGQMPAR
jgi:hypothetical protein